MKLTKSAIVALVITVSGCDAPSQTVTETASYDNFSYQTGDFDGLMNRERAGRGVGELRLSPKLSATAQGHANDMSSGGFFSHTSSNGAGVGRRARAQGYGYCWVAENISVGRTSEAEAFARWMASPGHRKNMLARDPTEYGLAVAPGNYRVLVLGQPGC